MKNRNRTLFGIRSCRWLALTIALLTAANLAANGAAKPHKIRNEKVSPKYGQPSSTDQVLTAVYDPNTNSLRVEGGGSGIGGSGTVTSVGLSLPSIFTVSGSPITTSGTITGALTSQSANLFLASPNGSSGAPLFRALNIADLPAINFTNLAGVLADSQLPADAAKFTGAITAGDCAKWSASGVVTDAGAVCGAGPGSALFQVNGASTPAQSPINFQSGGYITVSNPSTGNIQFNFSGPLAPANGGTGLTTLGANGQCLGTNGTAIVWQACGNGAPGGSNTQVQFNNSGAFGGSSDLTWSNSTATLAVTGTLSATSITAGGAAAGCLTLNELPTNGTNYVQICSPASVAASKSWTWPSADGTSGQVLSTNGSGALSWTTASGSANAIVNNPSATQTITPTSAAATGLVVNSAASPTADLFDVENNGTVKMSVKGSTVYANYFQSINTALALSSDAPSDYVSLGNPTDTMFRTYPDNDGKGTVAALGATVAADLPNDAAIGVNMVSTAGAISAGELVCVDAANADSVVPCAAGTTNGFLGFCPLGAASGAAAQVMLSGKVAAAISDGKVACALGNYVEASSTVAGDVSCVVTFPGAGDMIGFAISTAAATAGSTFMVVIDKR